MLNSLGQLVLKLASPGVPDFYQGSELWDLSLVDPDNRRPVDYSQRRRYLTELEPLMGQTEGRAASVAELLDQWPDGRIKLMLTAAGVRLRRRLAEVFLDGEYVPLEASGLARAHVVAFARRRRDQVVLAIATRWNASLTSDERPFPVGKGLWGQEEIRLPEGWPALAYVNVFTGERIRTLSHDGTQSVPVGDLLAILPAGLFVGALSADL
jgi:(1->4)-alpha-D-glucan 1-alpha-D-glucosylmutase